MVLSGYFADDELFQPGQGSKRFNHALSEIKLPLSDITCIIRNRMGHVIAGHGCYSEDRDASCAFKINGLLIARRKVTVK